MTIKEALAYGTGKLKNRVKTPQLDTEIILTFVLKRSKEFLFTYPEHNLTSTQFKKFEQLISERSKRKPVAYIMGKKEFYGLEFFINQDVLTPRPETEELVEKTLDLIHKLYAICHRPIRVLDLGTGSGCIAIAIAKNNKTPIEITASDLSKKALRIAQKNAKLHNINIKFIQSDLLENIDESSFAHLRQGYGGTTDDLRPDIIVANLPYITLQIYKKLAPEITKFEPKKALISKNRNYFYEKLKNQLKEKGWKPKLVFE